MTSKRGAAPAVSQDSGDGDTDRGAPSHRKLRDYLFHEEPGITLYCGDCREILPLLRCQTTDLVFFDPPYGLGVAEWDDRLVGLDLVPHLRSLLDGTGVLCATCSPHILPQMFTVLKSPRVVTWCKPNLPMRTHLRDFEWSTEFVMFERLGTTTFFEKPRGESGRDYWRIPVELGFLHHDHGAHVARKPLALMRRIVSTSCRVDGLIIDPFAGSGSTLVAAKNLHRQAIGIEIEPKYCEIAVKRLRQEVLPL
jgi:site-specific DNA-methyltransferase (adenine-specific)